MIKAQKLTKRYGNQVVLDCLDLEVQPGERVALLGLNGAGKTTLIRCLLGLVPFEGRLEVAGLDVARQGRSVREKVGYVPQRVPWLDGSLREAVEFFSRIRGIEAEAVQEQLERLGLDLGAHGLKAVRALSGGMLQKFLLALALASKVSLLLLDEPTANLDPPARRDLVEAIRSLNRQITVLLASHRLSDVRALADRIVVLHCGRVALDNQVAVLEESLERLSTLWIRPAPGAREALLGWLGSRGDLSLRGNGSAVAVRAAPDRRLELLGELADSEIAIESLWIERPGLEDLLDSIVRSGEGT